MKVQGCISCGVFAIVLVGGLVARCERAPLEIYSVLSDTTSNAWGRCVAEFENAAQSNMSALVSINTQESRILCERWLISLSRMRVPTNDVLHAEWLKTKAMWLAGSSRRFLDAEATNLWFAVSDVLGELRRDMKSEPEILSDCFASHTDSVISISSSCPDKLMTDFAVLDSQRDSAAMLSRLIVDTFGLRGLRHIDSEYRALVCSNIIQRACLTSDEQDRIRRHANLPD